MEIQYISIIIEAAIFILSMLVAIQKKKLYGYGFALTFAIYVFYDLAKLGTFTIDNNMLYPLFLIASVSMLWAVWMIYREN